MDLKNIANAALSSGKTDLPLSGSSMNSLNDLIGQGIFKNKADFVQFAIKAYLQYKMTGGQQLTQANVNDVIQQTGIGSSLSGSDIQDKLSPLLAEAFQLAGQNKLT